MNPNQQPAQAPTAKPVIPAQAGIQNPSNPVAQQPPQQPVPAKKRNVKKLIFIVLGVFALLAIVAVVAIVVVKNLGEAVDDNKPVELTWWGMWEDSSVVEPLIAQYQNSNPGVTVKYLRQDPSEYRERLANSLAQGKGPDIFRIHASWVPMFKGMLSTLPEDVMSEKEFSETFYRSTLEAVSTKEGLVGIPLQFDALALFINTDIFNTFAASVPETWSELKETAEDLTILDRRSGSLEQAGIGLGVISNVDHWEEILGLMLIQNRANLSEPSDSRAVGALQYYRTFVNENRAWDETFPNSTKAFIAKKVAMYIGPSARAYQIKSQQPSLKFKVVKVPQLPKFSADDPDITYATFWVESVWKKSKGSTQAWKFLKFLSEKENLTRLQQNQANSSRVYKEASPRIDMRDQGLLDRNIAGMIRIAPTARFWYLASDTNDGETGLNTQLSNIFANLFAEPRNIKQGGLTGFGLEVRTLLAQYGLATPPPPPEE